MWDFIKKWFPIVEEPEGPGALREELPAIDESKKIKFEEIVSGATPVIWTDKGNNIRKFPDYDQKRTMMCGAFSAKKMLGILYWLKENTWIEFSEEDVYQRRKNRPGVGMYMTDVFDLMKKGITLKVLTRAVIKTDADADNCKIEPYKRDVGSVFALKDANPIWINAKDIEEIASIIQVTGKGVLLNVFFIEEEWSREVPKVIDLGLTYGSQRALLHFGVATDFTLRNGVKTIVFDDSAPFGGLLRRYLTSETLKARSQYGAYPMTFKFAEEEIKPKFTGTIISFQECMRSIGKFPSNVSLVESFGPVTRSALNDFQKAYGLPQVSNWPLEPKTLAKVKELFG